MADIAFLLLVFFLVATTMNKDIGIQRKLPSTEKASAATISQKNILTVLVNSSDRILVNDEYLGISELKERAMGFIDNNGKAQCSYCKGSQKISSSDHPSKAVISLQNDRSTSYKTYVAVQNELTAAYNSLRNNLAVIKYSKAFVDLNKEQKREISNSYPMHISEAETMNLASN